MASLAQIFGVFAKIGAFTIGGGYAMIPLIKEEIIKRGWLPDEDFQDIIALAQSAPGLLAVNMAIFTGHRLKGLKGSIIACLGSILPSFLAILVIAMFISNFKDSPIVIKVFKGIRPVVVSLILVPMIQMAKKNNHNWWAWGLSLISLLLVAFLKVSPILIIISIIVIALTLAVYKERRGR